MAKLVILSRKGDEGIEFSPTDFAAAKAMFDSILSVKDSFAFATSGGESKMIRRFDPNVDEITIAKRIVGG